MCGRFVLNITPDLLQKTYNLLNVPDLEPRYNIAPSQQVAAVRGDLAGRRELVSLRWGLVPHWAKDVKIGTKLINARSETARDKPSFREALKHRRCVIPASGFYEWQGAGKQRIPHYIHPKDGGLLSLAGLWERWTSPAGEPLESCTILTTRSNELIVKLHDRMPVILAPQDLEQWLAHDQTDPARFDALLQPCSSELLTEHVVSTRVNSPGFDSPECLLPVV